MPKDMAGHRGEKMREAHSGGHLEHGTEMSHNKRSGGMADNLEPVDDFKGQAMDTAYGQAGIAGCRSDQKKIMAQFHHCYDDPGAGGY
jgi:hypothetical protein